MEKSLTLKNLVITGANKGIGFGIIDKLLFNKHEDYNIILCSRTKENAEDALKQLQTKYGDLTKNVFIELLDINNTDQASSFVKVIKEKYDSRIDCLVNNAGTSVNTNEFNTRVFDITVGTNFYSTVDFTEKILKADLIPKSGKIIFIGSSIGKLGYLKSKDLALRFMDKELTYDKLLTLSKEFRDAIENNTWESQGWPNKTYCISKILINKYANVLSKRKEIIDNGIQVYACCPGWVRTDMGGPKAHRSLEEGVVCPVYLIELDYKINEEYQGQFFYDCKVDSIDNYKF